MQHQIYTLKKFHTELCISQFYALNMNKYINMGDGEDKNRLGKRHIYIVNFFTKVS